MYARLCGQDADGGLCGLAGVSDFCRRGRRQDELTRAQGRCRGVTALAQGNPVPS
jgi:hypothetical protein